MLVVAALLAGFALRLFRLGADSLWYDETVSVYLARQAIPSMLAHTMRDIHPPGYYLLLHVWQAITQPSLAHGLEFLFVWPSLCFGMLVLPLLYATGRRLFGASVATVALWLAAISPFSYTYSQEVRMYTLGAALGLFCLWATLQFVDRPRLWAWLVAYVLAAAAGLYSLYYFGFLLVALNLAAVGWIWFGDVDPRPDRLRRIGQWVLAQVVVAALWLPWLPVVWRQVTDPPVPPWRVPWQGLEGWLSALLETSDALLAGHAPPGMNNLPWSMVALLMLISFLVLAVWVDRPHLSTPSTRRRTLAAMTTVLYFVVPIALLYLITAAGTPIYHVRYLFIYAPPFLLVAAWLVVAAWQTRRWIGVAMLVGMVVISASRLYGLWVDPRYRDGDHRQAVAQLAHAWRPGDVILANAGWIYPILYTYWPTELIGADAALPPPLDETIRLADYDYTNKQVAHSHLTDTPRVVLTGSVDGDASLGWGEPDADFYAISAPATTAALDALGHNAGRIWHYRMFDTVNDPAGVIRTWLANHTQLQAEFPINGRDLGTIQLFATSPSASPPNASTAKSPLFAGALRLVADTFPAQVAAADTLYASLTWDALPEIAQLPSDVSMSLRLYDSKGRMVAQNDDSPRAPSHTWLPGLAHSQVLALPIPASTVPGRYSLELIVYRQDDGTPLSLRADPQVVDGQRWQLGQLDLLPAQQTPEIPSVLARFDYIDLVGAQVTPQSTPVGTVLQTTLTWVPQPNSYQDTYQALFTLLDSARQPVQTWTEPLGGNAYPSANWPASQPVRDSHALPIDERVAPGAYTLAVSMVRASDGQRIAAKQGWIQRESIPIRRVIVE